MAKNKTKPTKASVENFITAIENPRRRSDTLIALKMYQTITGLPPVMWGPSIIGFGSRYYRYATGRDGYAPVACFSPRKANMTFYVGKSFPGAKSLYAKLGKYKKSVACLYINKLEDINLNVLQDIIKRQMIENAKVKKIVKPLNV